MDLIVKSLIKDALSTEWLREGGKDILCVSIYAV